MVKAIFRQREGNDGWKRSIVKCEGDYGNVNFMDPMATTGVTLRPLTDKLYLIDYLKVSYPRNETLTVNHVVDAIPEEILKDVYAIEFIMDFSAPWFASLFFKDVEQKKSVMFAALLTKKDTGKKLPGRKLTDERPLNISDDDWRRVRQEFYLDKKG